jgi:hypothetical protein
MIKAFIVGLSLLPLLAGCISQEYFFLARFQNACDNPVKVTARDYTNIFGSYTLGFDLNTQVNSDEVLVILDRVAYLNILEDPKNGVSSDYTLELRANEKQRVFDRASFLEVLEKSEHEFDRQLRLHVWTINDPSLCP